MPDFYPFARRVLFRLEAERAHHATLALMKRADSLGLLAKLTAPGPPREPVESVTVMGLRFPNRVGLAAGMDKKGEAISAFGSLGFGHVEIGTVTPRPQPGNAKPRLFRLAEHGAIINRMGFNNPGVAGMRENIVRSRKKFSGILGINIGKNADTPNENAINDYLTCLEGVYADADYVTANLSSPNTKGLRDLQNEVVCRELILRLQEKREQLSEEQGGKRVPLVIKIAPDLSDDAIRSLAAVFNETRIDGVITTNTTLDREAVAGHPCAEEAGGLSGRPLSRKSTKVLALLRSELDPGIALIGSGGVMSAADARAKMEAGAALVQVYTGLIYSGPRLIGDIIGATGG